MFDALKNYMNECDNAIKFRRLKVLPGCDYDNYANDFWNIRKESRYI